MKVVLHPLFLAIIVIAFLCGFGWFLLALLFAVVVHELSHVIAASYFGVRADKLQLLPFGAEVSIDCAFLPSREKIIILFAGSFGNLVAAVILSSFLWLFPQFFLVVEVLIVANAVPGIFNLLPVYPLDGGKILYLVTNRKRWVVLGANLVFGGLFVASCLFFFNVPLLLMCVTMIICMNFEMKSTNFVSKFNSALKSKSSRIAEVAITSDMNLLEVYKLTSAKYYTKFVVTDGGGKVFYENDLERMLMHAPLSAQIGAVFS